MRLSLLLILLSISLPCIANQATFTPNLGQITDAKGQERPDIHYSSSQQGRALFFQDAAFSWVANADESTKNQAGKRERIDVNFLGANANATILPEGETSGYANFYQGKSITHVKDYKQLTYKELYPKTDLVFYSNPSGLKYDFILKPGAEPRIRWQYKGIQSLTINEDGALVIRSELGTITESIPKVYFEEAQDRKAPKVSYVLEDQFTVRLFIEKYPSDLTLVIDPLATWATYYGGAANDYGRGLKRKGTALYMTGETQSANFPVTTGVEQGIVGGSRDAFITKFDLFGNRIWTTYFGGSGSDVAEDIDVENAIYITGHTTGNLPVTAGAHQATYNNNTDAFLAKFTTDGLLEWATYMGGGELDEAYDVAIDLLGDVVVTGATESTQFPVAGYIATAGAFQYDKVSGEDVFVMKFTATGTRLWGTYIGGSDTERGYNIDTDSNNDIVITGETYGGSSFQEFPVGAAAGYTAFQTTQGGGFGDKDAFVFKLSPDGATRRFCTFYGGEDIERGYGIVVDPADNIIITGNVDGNDFPSTFGTYQWTWGGGGSWGNSDAFLLKFNSTGDRLWATYYGGNNYDLGFSVDAPSEDVILLVGETASSNLPSSAGCVPCSGTFCGFVAQFNGDGSALEFASYLGGAGTFNSGLDVQADLQDNIFVTGYTTSTNYPIGGNIFQSTLGGSADAFLGLVNSDVCQVLPLELISFSAKEKNQAVELFWATANEINTAHFELQVSQDGENFVQVTEIAAAGNSNQTRHYDYLDLAPWRSGGLVLYYRLKMVDLDGSFTYSAIVTVSRKDLVQLSVFPSPTSGELFVAFDFSEEKIVELSLVDMQGRVVRSWPRLAFFEVQKALDLGGVANGIYTLSVVVDGRAYFRKVVIL